MSKQIIQIENTNADDFKNEIINGVVTALKSSGALTPNKDDEILLSREATAKMLSVSLVTLWDYTRKDLIPCFRIGSKIRYKKSDVLNALTKKNQF